VVFLYNFYFFNQHGSYLYISMGLNNRNLDLWFDLCIFMPQLYLRIQ